MLTPKWRQITDEVCTQRRLSQTEVLSRRRHRYLVHARWEIIWRMRHEAKMSLPLIGAKLGLTHPTVLYGVRKWEELR